MLTIKIKLFEIFGLANLKTQFLQKIKPIFKNHTKLIDLLYHVRTFVYLPSID